MKRIGAGLSGIVRKLGLEDAARLHGIQSRWRELVGTPLSEHLEPCFVSGPTLHISADSPVWLEQARFYSAELLKKLKPLGIGELKFKPGTRRAGMFSHAPARGASASTEKTGLSEAELEQIERYVCPVRDEGLRQIMRGIMARALRAPDGRRPRSGRHLNGRDLNGRNS